MSLIVTAERHAEKPAQDRQNLSQAEMSARRESLAASFHESRIEGARPNPDTQYIFEAYIRGQIEITDVIPWLDKHYGVARRPE